MALGAKTAGDRALLSLCGFAAALDVCATQLFLKPEIVLANKETEAEKHYEIKNLLEELDRGSLQYSRLIYEEDRDISKAGGRAMGHPVRMMDSEVETNTRLSANANQPTSVSSTIMASMCIGSYVSCILERLCCDYDVETLPCNNDEEHTATIQSLVRARAQVRARARFADAVQECDVSIDRDILGLDWAKLAECGLVPKEYAGGPSDAAGAPKWNTMSAIKNIVQYLRQAWQFLEPEHSPVEDVLLVVRMCIGRLIMLGVDTDFDVDLYCESCPCEDLPVHVRPTTAYFADLWIAMQSMLGQRLIARNGFLRIDSPPRPEPTSSTTRHPVTAAQWTAHILNKAIQEVNRCMCGEQHPSSAWQQAKRGNFVDAQTGVLHTRRIASIQTILKWALKYAPRMASESVSQYLLGIYERLDLWPGDLATHTCWAPFGDHRPRTIIQHRSGLTYVNMLADRVAPGPIKLLEKGDVDTSILVAAILFRLLVHAHHNVDRSDIPLETACLVWADQTEESGEDITSYDIPFLLQLNAMWAVVCEGRRTPFMVFSDALRVWLSTCMLLEQEGRAKFAISRLCETLFEAESASVD